MFHLPGKEPTLAIATLLGGVALGAAVAPLAGDAEPTYALIVAACLVIAILFGTRYFRLGEAEEKYHASVALDICFEGDGTPCVFPYPGTVGFQAIGTTVVAIPPVRERLVGWSIASPLNTPCTMLRLHVLNSRARPVNDVTVWLRDSRFVADGRQAHPEPERLRWRHDNTSERPESIRGRRIRPGKDPTSYVDLLTKSHPAHDFVLELAQLNLRQICLEAKPIYVHVGAEGFDEASGREVPPCERAFLIDFSPEGVPTIVPKTLEECGFSSSRTA
jgi:hypothetical protein